MTNSKGVCWWLKSSIWGVIICAWGISGCVKQNQQLQNSPKPVVQVSTPVSCAQFQKLDCLVSALKNVTNCLPTTSQYGVLNPIQNSCAFPNSTDQIQLVDQGDVWNFTAFNDGRICASIKQDSNGLVIQASGKVTQLLRYPNSGSLTLVCSDGKAYGLSATEVSQCTGYLPQSTYTSLVNGYSFGLSVGSKSSNWVTCTK